jgi:hypothetical protein
MEDQIMVKKQFEICSCRYLRRSHLVEIADNADRWDYNRQLDSEAIRTLPDDETIAYPVTMSFEHQHRYGEPCETHMRLAVAFSDGSALADVPLDYFEALPRSYIVKQNGKGLFAVLLDEKGVPKELRSNYRPQTLRKAVNYFCEHCTDPKVKKFVKVMSAA